MKKTQSIFTLILFLCATTFLSSCKDDDVPAVEQEEEEISEVTLRFTPVTGGTPLTFTWSDPDGGGAQNPTADEIVLAPNTDYILTMELLGPNDENITEEIAEEADEHMFFFGWTQGLFSSPSGTGNIASRTGAVNYGDEDSNGLPLGLITDWTTAGPASGTFTVVLKHQPNSKSETSTINTGETDIETVWQISVE